jgi:hypothetical protein
MDKSEDNFACPNCNAFIKADAKYCHECGQKRIHPKDHSVWHLIIESIGDFFHFDSKFLATLRPLLFRPGFLTKEYLQGKRARYFQPFKLFLFISFLYFLAAGMMNHRNSDRDLEASLPGKSVSGKDSSANKSEYSVHLAEIHDKIMDLPDDSLRKLVKIHGLNRFINISYPRENWFVRFLYKQTIKNRLQGSLTFGENMKKTVPKLIFILIPFFAFLLKLLYIRRKIFYFRHIIFSLHYLSFVFLLLWINLFGSLLSTWISTVLFLSMLVYLFIAMKKVYQQKMLRTLGKFVLLFFGSLVLMGVFFIMAASISFLLI